MIRTSHRISPCVTDLLETIRARGCWPPDLPCHGNHIGQIIGQIIAGDPRWSDGGEAYRKLLRDSEFWKVEAPVDTERSVSG